MKVKELIELLKGFDENETVFVGNQQTTGDDKDIFEVNQAQDKEVIILTQN